MMGPSRRDQHKEQITRVHGQADPRGRCRQSVGIVFPVNEKQRSRDDEVIAAISQGEKFDRDWREMRYNPLLRRSAEHPQIKLDEQGVKPIREEDSREVAELMEQGNEQKHRIENGEPAQKAGGIG